MKKIKLAYFGTPDFAATFLENILTDPAVPIEVGLVVTQPDQKLGRKQILTPSPVKVMAQKHGIPTYESSVKQLNAELPSGEFDLALLYAYGEIIPDDLIAAFPLGFWNIHPSLLPLYRNVAPMAYPLMLDDHLTGVSIIHLDSKLDHGPIVAQAKIQIDSKDKRPDLEVKLTKLAYTTFKELVNLSQIGNLPPLLEQDHENATYTRIMKKDDGFIPLETLKRFLKNDSIIPAEFPNIVKEYYENYPETVKTTSASLLLYNFYRGMYPWPGIWTTVMINGIEKRLKITEISYENSRVSLTKVQLEGKNEVSFKEFNTSYHVFE